MSDPEPDEAGSSRGKSPQSQCSSRDASPDDSVYRRFDWAENATYEDWTRKHKNSLTALFLDKKGPTTEDVMEQLFGSLRYPKGNNPYSDILSNVFANATTKLDEIKEWYQEDDWDSIYQFFEEHKGSYYGHLQDVFTERQDNLFLQKLLHAKTQELENSQAKVEECQQLVIKMAGVIKKTHAAKRQIIKLASDHTGLSNEDKAQIKALLPDDHPTMAGAAQALADVQHKLAQGAKRKR